MNCATLTDNCFTTCKITADLWNHNLSLQSPETADATIKTSINEMKMKKLDINNT